MEAITLAQTSHGTASTRDEMVGVLMLDAAVMVLIYAPLQRKSCLKQWIQDTLNGHSVVSGSDKVPGMGHRSGLGQRDKALLAQYLDSRQTCFAYGDSRDFNITQHEFSCDLLDRQAIFTKAQQFG